MNEADIQREVMMELSRMGAVVWRNNTGAYVGWDTVRKCLAMLRQGRIAACIKYLKSLYPIKGGLCVGSSDLIGFTQVEITSNMVGQTVSVFVAVEVKSSTGKLSKDQKNFLNTVNANGGIGFVARRKEDVKKFLTKTGI